MAEKDTELKQELLKMSESDDEKCLMIDLYYLLDSKYGKLKLSELPIDVSIYAYDDFCNNWLFNGEKKGYLSRCKAIPYYDWDKRYSVKTFGAKIIEVINTWLPEGMLLLDSGDTDRDGQNYYIWYFLKIDESLTLRDAVAYGDGLERILENQAETLLGKGELNQEVLNDEVNFSLGVLLPLLRKMGYETPQYTHGPREFGKDIIFSDTDKLGTRRNFAVQVKAGDVSGEAAGQLDKIVAQVNDALGMPYNDIYSKEKKVVTDVIIMITGRFVGNARDKICEKLDKTLRSNNVHFLDIDKVQSLIAKYVSEN